MSTTDADSATLLTRKDGLTPDMIAAWLKANPEFLADHSELLAEIDPPGRIFAGQDDRVVDFQKAMIHRLRTEADKQSKFRRALISAGESNQDAHMRIQRTVLLLLEARGFEDFMACLTGPVVKVLGLAAIAVGIEMPEGQRPPMSAMAALSPGSVDRLIGKDRPARLRGHIDRERVMPPGPFGALAKDLKSDALIRMQPGRGAPPALLALGASDPAMFAPDQGTDLLVFLGGVVERMIGQWLDLPRP